MLPRLVIVADKKERKKYTEKVAKELSVRPYDIFTVTPEDGIISIDQMRQLSSLFLTQIPDTRLIVIDSFDQATVEAQNSLLKLLEEKNKQALFLLFVVQKEGVIPTIKSRTQVIYPDTGTVDLQETDKQAIAKLVSTFTGSSLAMLNSEDHLLKTREEALERIDKLIFYYQELLKNKPTSINADILKKLLVTRRDIQAGNVNPQFAYDILLIFITEIATMK